MKKILVTLVVVLGILGVTGAAMAEPGGSVTLGTMERGGSVIMPH
jgi:hypothetical protein